MYNIFWLPLIPTGTKGILKPLMWFRMMWMFVVHLSLGLKMKWYVMLIFSVGETQRRNRKNASVRKENGILLHPTSRGRNIPGPGKEWVKNPKQCDCDILCIFSLLYSKAYRLLNLTNGISAVQLLLMIFRLLNKFNVERMRGDTVSLKGMPCNGHWCHFISKGCGVWSQDFWMCSFIC